MSNLANGRIILKLKSGLVHKNYSSMYSSFILNLYIVYERNNWSRNPTNNFKPKNCLFGTVKLKRNADKNKFTYNDREIAFNGKVVRNFGNGFARNIVIFGVDNIVHWQL